MTCPACLEPTVDTAERCKCGYAFHGPQTDSIAVLGSIEKTLRTIKNIMVFWLIAVLACVVLWIAFKIVSEALRG